MIDYDNGEVANFIGRDGKNNHDERFNIHCDHCGKNGSHEAKNCIIP